MAAVRTPAVDLLARIREKVEAGERLDLDDGVALLEAEDLLRLGELAELARRARGGDDRVAIASRPSPVVQGGSASLADLVGLRELQDATGDVPSVTVRESSAPTGAEVLKLVAASRLLLDNVPNVAVAGSLPLMQVALHFGANEVSAAEHELDEVVRFVRAAGRVPVTL